MAEKIIMPQLGESIAEGTVVKWLKNPGDSVQKDENVLLISTDKVEAEIPSPISGVLVSIEAQPGQTLPVGAVLGYVGEAGSEIKVSTPKPIEEKKSQKQPPSQVTAPKPLSKEDSPSRTSENRFLSPLVRQIASVHGVQRGELEHLPGSGRNNRLTKEDMLAYVQFREQGPKTLEPTKTLPKPPQIQMPVGERELIQPASGMRKVIMENMIKSRQTSAHVTTFFEIDYTKIDQIRNQHKDRFLKEEGVALTYTTFLAYGVCQVLKRHPYINAEIMGQQIKFKKDIHLGIAVAITEPEPGLMVPVIKNADQMNLRGLAHSIVDLAARVRGKKIKPDELSGGTFTITNPGNYGAIIGTPIINQPQVAILGVGNIQKRPVVIELDGTDMIAIRKMGVLSLSFDHRLIDGATADIFMADLKNTLENWSMLP